MEKDVNSPLDYLDLSGLCVHLYENIHKIAGIQLLVAILQIQTKNNN